MQYFLKRGEEKYGPYSLAELQQYVQSGNIAMTDLAQSEGMTDWALISDVIGNVQVPQAPVHGVAAMEMPMGEQVPLPPNLHWALLILINVFTRNFFSVLVWSLIQANWARKLDKDNSTMILVAMYPAGIVAGIIASVAGTVGHSELGAGIGGLLILGGAIASIVGCFKIKSAMEAYYNFNENIGLKLSGVMTFFFGSIYIQFHINRLARWKQTGVLN